MINRGNQWQCGYVIPKGGFDALRAQGIDVLRTTSPWSAPFMADRVMELADWTHVSLLVVTVNRLRLWHRPGLLCIGDSAHAMSPVGGVGINLAIQDAIATANILAPTLARKQTPSDALLAAVQRRREPAVKLTQALQVFIQKRVISNVLGERRPAVDAALAAPPLPAPALATANSGANGRPRLPDGRVRAYGGRDPPCDERTRALRSGSSHGPPRNFRSAFCARSASAATFMHATIADLFARDPRRFADFHVALDDLLFDFSKHRIDRTTRKLLLDLARAAKLEERRAALFAGAIVNPTEGRPALHVALRNMSGDPMPAQGRDVMPEVLAERQNMLAFAEAVRGGTLKTAAGEPLRPCRQCRHRRLGPRSGDGGARAFPFRRAASRSSLRRQCRWCRSRRHAEAGRSCAHALHRQL